MSGKKGFLIVGIIAIILSVLAWFVIQAYRASLIVSMGIIGANSVRLIPSIILLVIGLILIIAGLPGYIKFLRSNSAKKRQQDLGLQYRSKKSGPEEIRQQLSLMLGQRSVLAGKIDRCIASLDEIEKQLDRFDRLIKINEASALADAREALEESQQTICSNLKWIINSSVVASDQDQAAMSRLDVNLSEVLDVNKTLLDKDEEFLLDLADHLSKVKGEGQTFQLDAWRDTISTLNQKSLKG